MGPKNETADRPVQKQTQSGLIGGAPETPADAGRTSSPSVAPSPQAAPAEPDIPWYGQLGYPSADEAIRGTRNLRTYSSQVHDMATEARGRVGELEAENRRLQEQLAARHGQAPPSAADPLFALEQEARVPADLLRPAIDAHVRQVLGDMMAPVIKSTQADQQMVDHYGPEYLTLKPRLDAFIAGDPHVRRVVQIAEQNGDPVGAREYALLAWRERVEREAREALMTEASATERTIATQRTHAQPLVGGPGSRMAPDPQQTQRERIERARQMAQQGDRSGMIQLIKERLPLNEEQFQRLFQGGLHPGIPGLDQ